jgi:hypothetical protein
MKLIRNIGLYLGHLLTAVFGTAILSTGFGRLFHPTSIMGVIWKEWILDILLAGLLGILAYRISRSKVAVWIWILPTVWLGLRLLSLVSTLGGRGQTALWYEVSGGDCVHGIRDMGCANFFLFAIPFIRLLAYSIGALTAMQFAQPLTAQFAKDE